MTVSQQPATASPRRLFRLFALSEMVTWALLIAALLLRGFDVVNLVPIAGGIHGFVFLCYAATTLFVWVNQQWRFSLGVIGLLLAVVPFATAPFEWAVDRRGLLSGDWRLRPGGDEPHGFVEHVQAWILRHLILALVLLVLFITVLFVTLLWLGPPIRRD